MVFERRGFSALSRRKGVGEVYRDGSKNRRSKHNNKEHFEHLPDSILAKTKS